LFRARGFDGFPYSTLSFPSLYVQPLAVDRAVQQAESSARNMDIPNEGGGIVFRAIFPFLFFALSHVAVAESVPSHAGTNSDPDPGAFWDKFTPTDTSVDIGMPVEGRTDYRSTCQATPVENTPLKDNPDFCRTTLFTDHHCVAQIARNKDFDFSISHNGQSVSVPREKFQIYTMTDNHDLFATKRDNSVAGDAALISVITECYKLRFLRPIELGDPNYLTNPLYFQKRRAPIVHTQPDGSKKTINPGGNRRLAGYYVGDTDGLSRYELPIPQGLPLSVNGGDSGGAVYDGFGRLVASIIGSSDSKAEQSQGTFTVVIDKTAIPWAKAQLAALQRARPGEGIVSMNVKRPDNRPRFGFDDGGAIAVNRESPKPAPIEMPRQNQVYVAHGEKVDYIPLATGHGMTQIAGHPIPQGVIGFRLNDAGALEWVGPGKPNQKPPEAVFTSTGHFAFDEPLTQARAQTHSQVPAPVARPLTAADRAAIYTYENEMRYSDGEPRYPFSKQNPLMFRDVPPGGNGKIIVAYFGPRRSDVDALAATNPLFEARNYPIESPEHKHAQLFPGVGALGIDGLGRKISRYNGPMDALSSLMNGNEGPLLRRYLDAKGAGQAPLVVEKPKPKPAPQFASLPRFAFDTGEAIGGGRHSTPAPEPAPAPVPKPESSSLPRAGSARYAFDDGVAVPAPTSVSASPYASLPASRGFDHSVPGAKPFARQPAGGTEFNPSGLANLLNTNCIKCHNGNMAPVFPQFLGNWPEWEKKLIAKDKSATDWLTRLNSHVVHGQMLRLGGLSRHEGTGKEFNDFVAFQFNRFNPHLAGEPNLGSEFATELIDGRNRALYRSLIAQANIPDPAVRRELMEYDGIYDGVGSPAWSFAPHGGDSGRRGQRPVDREPANPPKGDLFDQLPDGSFSWREPFRNGFAVGPNTQGLEGFVVVRFPRDAAGNIIKGVKGFEQKPTGDAGDLNSPFGSFPDGTKVFQVLYSRSLGQPVVIDVESRQKRVDADGTVTWIGNSNRQDASPENITEWVNANLSTLPSDDARKLLSAVQSTQSDEIRSELGGNRSGGTPFIENGRRTNSIRTGKSQVHDVSPSTLLRMYREMPLESALGSRGWQLEPTNVFRNSHRGIPINSKTCNNCHRNAGEEFRHVFNQAGLTAQFVSAYGNVGGYDGILSAPWFSQQALDQYGSQVLPEMRPEWAKFFENYDPRKHNTLMFQRTPRSQ